MAVAGLAVAFFSRRIDRRRGIVLSLALLSIPTALLAVAPDLATFAALRIVQGVCMAAAFTLTLAYLGERCSGRRRRRRLRRLHHRQRRLATWSAGCSSAARRRHLGLASNFFVFAALNLAGAALVCHVVRRSAAGGRAPARPRRLGGLARASAQPGAARRFAIGFCILFAFIGTFTYVNFVLVRPPFGLGMMRPRASSTSSSCRRSSPRRSPAAWSRRFGTRHGRWRAGLAGARRPAAAAAREPARASSPAWRWSRSAPSSRRRPPPASSAAPPTRDRGAASGLYLASYFLGGLVGSAVLGAVFDASAGPACVAGIAAALLVAGLLCRCACACRKHNGRPGVATHQTQRGGGGLRATGRRSMTSQPLPALLEAFAQCVAMDAPLRDQRGTYADAVRQVSPEFIAPIAAQFDGLRGIDGGALEPQVGETMPSFRLPDEIGALLSASTCCARAAGGAAHLPQRRRQVASTTGPEALAERGYIGIQRVSERRFDVRFRGSRGTAR